jgi:glycosyltransferase involved in cell wall biosynthesis
MRLMPRLVHLANFPNIHGGSYIPWLLAVLDEAKRRGWRGEVGFPASVVGADWTGSFEEREIPIHWIPERGRISHSRHVEEIVGAGSEPTVLHTHFTSFDIGAVMAARRRTNIRVFWHIHTVLEDDPLTVIRHSAKFLIFRRRVDRVLVPAANIGDGLASRFVPRDKIVLMPSAIDADEFRPPSATERADARQWLGIPDDCWMLFHIGRAWELKGGPRFLAAAKILRERGLPVIAVTLRGGEAADRDIAALGTGDFTINLGRVESMHPLLWASDCFVAPSEGEGMPFSIVESLASGVPVVASDLPGHRYLGDPLDACTIVATEPAPLADAIAAMLRRGEEKVARERQEARDWVIANLSLGPASKRMCDYYEQALTDVDRGHGSAGMPR